MLNLMNQIHIHVKQLYNSLDFYVARQIVKKGRVDGILAIKHVDILIDM